MKKIALNYKKITENTYYFIIGKKNRVICLKIKPEIHEFHHLAGGSHHSAYRNYDRTSFFELAMNTLDFQTVFLSEFQDNSDNYQNHLIRLDALNNLDKFFCDQTNYIVKKVNKERATGTINSNYSYFIELNQLSYKDTSYTAILFFAFKNIDSDGYECHAVQSLSIYYGNHPYVGSQWKVLEFKTK